MECWICDDKVCRKEWLLKIPKLTKKQDLRAQSPSEEVKVLNFPLLPHAKTYYQAIEKD